ncbi:MAG: desR [Acidimicrobiales bacterium]|nr:desR [Acidimicrobiales bacterium]
MLVEDQAMVRGAMATLLSLEDDIEVVADLGSGEHAVAEARRVQPDVALLDIELPGISGIEVAAALTTAAPSCRVMIVTTFGRPGYLQRALDAGASGFLLKDAPVEELAVAIRRVHAGERVVDPELALSALQEGHDPLTTREHEVLQAARDHDSVAELARRLHLSEGTVRNHLSAVIQKLGARNRGEAVAIAEQRGWL